MLLVARTGMNALKAVKMAHRHNVEVFVSMGHSHPKPLSTCTGVPEDRWAKANVLQTLPRSISKN